MVDDIVLDVRFARSNKGNGAFLVFKDAFNNVEAECYKFKGVWSNSRHRLREKNIKLVSNFNKHYIVS